MGIIVFLYGENIATQSHWEGSREVISQENYGTCPNETNNIERSDIAPRRSTKFLRKDQIYAHYSQIIHSSLVILIVKYEAHMHDAPLYKSVWSLICDPKEMRWFMGSPMRLIPTDPPISLFWDFGELPRITHRGGKRLLPKKSGSLQIY